MKQTKTMVRKIIECGMLENILIYLTNFVELEYVDERNNPSLSNDAKHHRRTPQRLSKRIPHYLSLQSIFL